LRALGLVLGANLGGSLLAVITTGALGHSEVRQVPLGNLMFKVLGVVVAAPFAGLWLRHVSLGDPATVVVMFHLTFSSAVGRNCSSPDDCHGLKGCCRDPTSTAPRPAVAPGRHGLTPSGDFSPRAGVHQAMWSKRTWRSEVIAGRPAAGEKPAQDGRHGRCAVFVDRYY
jgi:hypothetical protein